MRALLVYAILGFIFLTACGGSDPNIELQRRHSHPPITDIPRSQKHFKITVCSSAVPDDKRVFHTTGVQQYAQGHLIYFVDRETNKEVQLTTSLPLLIEEE